MATLREQTYRFKAIPLRIPAGVFTEGQTHSKIHPESQRTPNDQYDLQKNKAGDAHTSNFRTHYNLTVIKTG